METPPVIIDRHTCYGLDGMLQIDDPFLFCFLFSLTFFSIAANFLSPSPTMGIRKAAAKGDQATDAGDVMIGPAASQGFSATATKPSRGLGLLQTDKTHDPCQGGLPVARQRGEDKPKTSLTRAEVSPAASDELDATAHREEPHPRLVLGSLVTFYLDVTQTAPEFPSQSQSSSTNCHICKMHPATSHCICVLVVSRSIDEDHSRPGKSDSKYLTTPLLRVS